MRNKLINNIIFEFSKIYFYKFVSEYILFGYIFIYIKIVRTYFQSQLVLVGYRVECGSNLQRSYIKPIPSYNWL